MATASRLVIDPARALALMVILIAGSGNAASQALGPAPRASCVVTALNRTAPLQEGGFYEITNLPGTGTTTRFDEMYPQPFRVRAVCDDGTLGETPIAFPVFALPVVATGAIVWGQNTLKPTRVQLAYPSYVIRPGEYLVPTVAGFYTDGPVRTLSSRSTGTGYRVSDYLIARTDPDGQLYLQNSGLDSPGTFVVTAENDGVTSTRVMQVRLGGKITGVVYQAGGAVPAAGVRIVRRGSENEVVTDANGAYLIEDLPTSFNQIELIAIDPLRRSFASTSFTVAAGSGVAPAMVLSGVGSVDVRVLDAGGQPIAGVEVAIVDKLSQYANSVNGELPRPASGKTNASGMLHLDGVAAGEIAPALSARQYAVAPLDAKVSAGASLPLTITVSDISSASGANLTGTVTQWEDAAPGAGLVVRITEPDGLMRKFSYVTGADGRYHFEGLKQHRFYAIELIKNDTVLSTQSAWIGDGADNNLDLRFSKTVRLSGTATRDGVALANVEVRLSSFGGVGRWILMKTVNTDSAGHFSFGAVWAGPFRLDAVAPGGAVTSVEFTNATTAEETVQNIVLGPDNLIVARARLAIEDRDSRKALGGAQVSVINSRCTTACVLGVSTADTAFVTPPLELGVNRFSVRRGDRVAEASVSVDASADGKILDVAVPLAPGASDTLNVLGFTEQRSLHTFTGVAGEQVDLLVAGVQVQQTPAAKGMTMQLFGPDKELIQTFASSAYDTFSAANNLVLPADGTYSIVVSSGGNTLGGYWVEAFAAGAIRPLTLDPQSAPVTGTVYAHARSTPVARQLVELISNDSLAIHERRLASAAGVFRFEGVPAAPLTLQALSGGQVSARASGEISAPGVVLQKDLHLETVTTLEVRIAVGSGLTLPPQIGVRITDWNGERAEGPLNIGPDRHSDVLSVVAVGDSSVVSVSLPDNPLHVVSQTIAGRDGASIPVELELAGASLRGRVLYGDRRAAAGVWVAANSADDQHTIAGAVTDTAGEYAFEVLPVGRALVLQASNPGSGLPTSISLPGLPSGPSVAPDLVLTATGSLEGLVRYSTGEAIGQAKVVVSGASAGSMFNLESSTDQDGKYRLENVPVATPLNVTAVIGSFGVSQSRSVALGSQGEVRQMDDFVFASGATLHINIVDGDKLPNRLLTGPSRSECGPNRVVVTTSEGVSNIAADQLMPLTGLPPGRVQVDYYPVCYGPDYGVPLASASLEIGKQPDYTLELAVPVVRGTMRYADGRFVRYPNAEITQAGANQSVLRLYSETDNYTAETESRIGDFFVIGLNLGDYSVVATQWDGSKGTALTGTLENIRNVDLGTLTLPAPPFTGEASDLTGIVSMGGQPQPGVRVTLTLANGYSVDAVTNDTGAYQFVDIAAGSATLSIDTGWEAVTATVTVGTQALVTTDLQMVALPYDGAASDVSGSVTDNGVPVVDATVELTSAQGTQTTWTNGDGVYKFERVEAGEFTVQVSERGRFAKASGTAGSAARLIVDLVLGDAPKSGMRTSPNGLEKLIGVRRPSVLPWNLDDGELFVSVAPFGALQAHWGRGQHQAQAVR